MDEPLVDEFWDWIIERQQIHVRKEIEGQDPPWTDDPVLQTRHFANVYRSLDRVTRYYIDEIANETTPESTFLSTALFRILNTEIGWNLVGQPISTDDDLRDIVRRVNDARNDGATVFNGAYMITGAAYPEYDDKMEKYTLGMLGKEIVPNLDRYWWDHLDDDLEPQTTPDRLTDAWTEIPGISEFIAYEWYCDLTHCDWFPYGKMDYVNTGPGARRGINWITGQILSDVDDPDRLRQLVDQQPPVDTVEWIEGAVAEQDEWLPDDFWRPDGQPLTLRSIEHSLCEFSKYKREQWNREHGVSSRMRRYDGEARDQETFGSF